MHERIFNHYYHFVQMVMITLLLLYSPPMWWRMKMSSPVATRHGVRGKWEGISWLTRLTIVQHSTLPLRQQLHFIKSKPVEKGGYMSECFTIQVG